jgi:alpha-amylase
LDDNGKYQWYKDASKKETLIPESVPTECDLTINYKSTLGDDVAAYIYKETNKPAGEWPGKTMTATAGHEGWYTMHLTLDNSTDYSLILNDDGHGNQLKDVTLSTKGKAEAEYWFDGSLSETKPADWKYVTTIHYLASGMGSTIYNYMWGADASATGAGVGKEWPGGQISANADHLGWYDVVYTQDVKQNFSCIFNNNNGTQTDNIDVSVTSTSTELWVTGTKGDTTVYKTAPDSWEAPVPDHTFTIYYYNEDLSTDTDMGKVDLWMWNAGLDGSYVFDGTYYDAENKVTWFKQTITVAGSNVGKTVGLKARYDNTKGWDGGSDTADRSFTISGDENEVLYYVDGSDPVHEKPVIVPTEKRYLVLDYENPGLKEKGITPQFYTWSSGYASVLTDFTYVGGDKWTVTIPAKPSCTKVDFCIALDSTGDPWIKDGGDHSVTFPSDQKVIYASMKAGSEPEIAMPYNVGYEVDAENQQVSYYYRDDDAFVDGTLKDMKVSVDVNGTEYPMTYNDTTKRFEYVKNGLTNGKTHYRYKANGNYVVDAFNSNSEKYNDADYSYFEYYKLNATVTAEVMNKSFNYNENNVVKFKVKQADTDTQKLEVASASIDVSSLGGSSEMPIEPELQAVTISATVDTTLGTKTLPITVTDQYGNKFSTTVDVEITDRVKKNENDFDWDEAVVYFMMTDRFFDGNESNNTASGTDTYGDNPGLYHGGDFAGVTAKLDYLQDLGVNTIWLTPIVKNIAGVTVTDEGKEDVPYNAAYHGYWASDFTKLNPTMGTTEEFKTMISEAHKRGMRIMVDIVVNHAGYGTESTFADMLRDKSVSEGDIKSWQSGLPDFATEKADVRAKLVEWQTSWMKDYGVDYFRVDTVKHVDSTTWAALKNSTTEVNPSFKMIGEYYGAGYASNGSTLGSGQMDADLDFDFNDQATSFVSGNISSVEKFLSARNSALNNAYMTGQFLSSHDEDGFKASLINGKGYTEDEATSAALVAATLQLTAKGIPVIYYGEEVGLSGLNNYPYQTNRYDMDFSKATKDNVTYQHYKNLLSIRNAYTDVFARGSRTVVAGSDEEGYDVVSRSYGGTTLYVGMNIKDTAKEVKVPVSLAAGTEVKDLYSGATYTVGSDKTVAVTIPAAKDGGTVILTEVKKTKDPGKTDPTPEKVSATLITLDKKTAGKQQNDTKKAAPKSGDDNEAATYVCLLGLAMVAITAATYRKKRACN